jgi:hypothetical protein
MRKESLSKASRIRYPASPLRLGCLAYAADYCKFLFRSDNRLSPSGLSPLRHKRPNAYLKSHDAVRTGTASARSSLCWRFRLNRSSKRQRRVTMPDLVRVFGWPMPFDPGLAPLVVWRRTGVARHKPSEQIGSARVISQSISAPQGWK